MKLLQELHETVTSSKLVKEYKLAVTVYKNIKNKFSGQLTEGLISDHNGELERQFDEIVQRLKAAHRALSLISKLPPEERKPHKSRVFKNMNHINKMLYDIMLKLGYSDEEHNIEFRKNDIKPQSNSTPMNRRF